MSAFACEHTFKTTISASKFEALVAKACRQAFGIEIIGHDPGVVPAVRLFTVGFTTPEDRDRVRIAMRFVEKEQAAAGLTMSRTTAPASASPQLATA